MDVALRLPAMDLQGVKVSNAKEAVQFVIKHSLEERKNALMLVNQSMIENKDKIKDVILG